MRRIIVLSLLLLALAPSAAAWGLPILFETGFENPNISSDILVTGNWEIQAANNNHFLHTATDDEGAALFLANGAEWTDYFVDADIRLLRGVFNMDIRTIENACDSFRLTIDADKKYMGMLIVKQQGDRCITLDVMEDRKNFPYDWSATWTNVEVTMIGDDLMVFVDGESVLGPWDSTYTIGSVRFSVEPETTLDIDNIRVRDLADKFPEEAPLTLATYEDSPAATVAELADLGYVPAGGQSLFYDEFVWSLDGEGFWFSSLGSEAPYTNVVLGGYFLFTPSIEGGIFDDTPPPFEFCGFIARVVTCNCGYETTNFIESGFTNQGTITIFDQLSMDEEPALEVHDIRNPDYSLPHHLIMVLVDDQVSVFVDGEIIYDQMDAVVRDGSIAFTLEGANSSAMCEVQNAWGYTFD